MTLRRVFSLAFTLRTIIDNLNTQTSFFCFFVHKNHAAVVGRENFA